MFISPQPPGLFKVTCGKCGWSGYRQSAAILPRHRCPDCGSDQLTTEPHRFTATNESR